MSDRVFDVAKNPIGDHRKRYVIECARCGVNATVNCNKDGGLPSVVISRKLIERGWVVGADNKRDLCPMHAKHPPKPLRDLETPLVDRIDKSIQSLEQSLGEFLQLPQSRHHDKVVSMLSAFHERVFGSPA